MAGRIIAFTVLIGIAVAPIVIAQTQLTAVIKDIPDKIGAGKEVTIIGYYRGWNLLKEIKQAPPVTRSDWVITDQSGAIYVQSKKMAAKGQEKLGGKELLPGDMESTQHIVRLTGIVRLTSLKQPYIEPITLELLK